MYVTDVTSDLLTERFEMRANREWVERVDEWRRKQPDIPSRAEAVRRLVDKALLPIRSS